MPGPYSRGHWELGQILGADVCLVAINLIVVHQISALTGLSDFSISDCGLQWTLQYGVLLALLEQCERCKPGPQLDHRRARRSLKKAVFWTTLLTGISAVLSSARAGALASLIAAAPLNYFSLLGWRAWRRHLSEERTQHRVGVRNVLIAGAGRTGQQIANSIAQNPSDGRVVVGFLDDFGPVSGEVRGGVRDLARVAITDFVDEVIVAMPHQRDLARQIVFEARRNHLDVSVVPDLMGFEAQSLSMSHFGSAIGIAVHEEHAPVEALLLKRFADITISLSGLLLVAPLLAALALVIRVDSPGSAFYLAPRMGKKGRRFLCCKLRTMVTNADTLKEKLRACNERQGPFFKLASDPRITRVGKFLRRYSLDEIPQLWNVLRGDMSLVGPRPHPLDDFERYQLGDLQRLNVTPGITGLWQVTARRDPSFQRNMTLDMEYIQRWSLWMDLRILCKTISVVFQGSGA